MAVVIRVVSGGTNVDTAGVNVVLVKTSVVVGSWVVAKGANVVAMGIRVVSGSTNVDTAGATQVINGERNTNHVKFNACASLHCIALHEQF